MRHLRLILAIGLAALVAILATGPSGDLSVERALAQTDPTLPCRIGNLNPPAEGYPGVFFGAESYAYFVNPEAQCACENPEFSLESVAQILYFDASQVPVTLTVQARLLTADPDADCGFVPGPELCAGLPTQITVDSPGFFQVTAPLAACGPFPTQAAYFLALDYVDGGPASLAIDTDPQACVVFVNDGSGWLDLDPVKALGDKTGGGKGIVFGDIICGIVVGTETTTWGTIKSLFK